MCSPRMKTRLRKMFRTLNCFWIFYELHENCHVDWGSHCPKKCWKALQCGVKDQEIAIASKGGLTKPSWHGPQAASILQSEDLSMPLMDRGAGSQASSGWFVRKKNARVLMEQTTYAIFWPVGKLGGVAGNQRHGLAVMLNKVYKGMEYVWKESGCQDQQCWNINSKYRWLGIPWPMY